MSRPAAELAASEGADRHREGGAARLFAEAERGRRVELLGAVRGEAVARAAERVDQHRDGGRVGAEMRVQMLIPRSWTRLAK
jgi:hypothetical protein